MLRVLERRQTTLIFVEDPALGQALQQDCLAIGFEVLLTETPQAAHDCLATNSIDVVITDSTSVLNLNQPSANGHHPNGEAPSYNRPITCLLTNSTTPPAHPNLDIVLPFVSSAFIVRQVQTHSAYRQYIASLQRNDNEIQLLKKAIVRNVSHELKTPLLQVKSAVALIAEEAPDDRLTQMAVTSTARLETVVRNITLLAGSMKGDFGPVLVQESIDQAIRNLRRSWEHRNDVHRIQRNIASDLPPITADKKGIGIVMQQLLDNALKFSKDADTPVEVHALSDADGIHISVRDYGIGIAEDQIPLIFDAFYQVDSSTTRRYNGTGVGLAIVRLILEKHNVDINVVSEAGAGSTFAFALPTASL